MVDGSVAAQPAARHLAEHVQAAVRRCSRRDLDTAERHQFVTRRHCIAKDRAAVSLRETDADISHLCVVFLLTRYKYFISRFEGICSPRISLC